MVRNVAVAIYIELVVLRTHAQVDYSYTVLPTGIVYVYSPPFIGQELFPVILTFISPIAISCRFCRFEVCSNINNRTELLLCADLTHHKRGARYRRTVSFFVAIIDDMSGPVAVLRS